MTDLFARVQKSRTDPASYVWLVTPHDTNALDPMPRKLELPRGATGTTLTIVVINPNTNAEEEHTYDSGDLEPGDIVAVSRIVRVKATGTDWTRIRAYA